MNEQILWKLVQNAKEAKPTAYQQTQYLTLVISSYSAKDILSLKNIYWKLLKSSFTADLWAAAYVLNSGCSDQDFIYFRNWLILQGQATFKKTIQDPEYLADYLHLPLREPLQQPDFHHKIALLLAHKTDENLSLLDYRDEEENLNGEFWKNDSDIIDKVPLLCQLMGWGNEVSMGEWVSDNYSQYNSPVESNAYNSSLYYSDHILMKEF